MAPPTFQQLNREQAEAVTTTEGPLLILAGAGSGKTRVLVSRVAHLIESGRAEPWQILAVTFTNKAAGEMRERLETLLGESVSGAWIGTFHAMSARILRMEGHRLGLAPSFTIYDADDSRKTLKATLSQFAAGSEKSLLRQVALEIDRAKNQGLMPRAFAAQHPNPFMPALKLAIAAYPRYQERLRQAQAVDFGDLLLLSLELLRHHPEVKNRFAQRFRYILVDEFQDTNAAQYLWLQLLASQHQNLAVVGDDDQSIYGWRGADIQNILNFPNRFPNAAVIKLEQNYRSSGHILDAANAVIAQNRNRHAKRLVSSKPSGNPIRLAITASGEDEAHLVAEELRLRISAGESPDRFAVLYRQNAQSRLFEESLSRLQVPYSLVGGVGFYDRKEVKDILSYLRLIANPASEQDFLRILNVPARKIGKTSVDRLVQLTESRGLQGLHRLSVSDAELSAAKLNRPAIARLRGFARLIEALQALSQNASAADVARQVIEQSGYPAYLTQSDPSTAEDRLQNVHELVNSIAERELSFQASTDRPEEGLGIAGAKTPLQAFLDEASLVSPSDQPVDAETVSLMTLHAAKGLEFPVVFMVGMEENTFPSARAVEAHEAEAIEEERRLCYVGITRAMEDLYLLGARWRMVYGSSDHRQPSRFLGELPESAVEGLSPPESPQSRPEDVWAPEADDEEAIRDDSGGHDPFAIGQDVHHALFGLGVVVASHHHGKKRALTIAFDEGEVKQVLARYVTSLRG